MAWKYGEPMNDKAFLHRSSNSIELFSQYCDFRTGVYIVKPEYIDELSEVELTKAIAENIGYHAINIFKELNGFNGYGNIQYNFVNEKTAKILKKEFGFDVD
jgi:hypothetical protein